MADVELVHVTKTYGDTTAVDGIDLKIPGGCYCCLLGPSGCGKTTTLRLIAGHEQLSGGDIAIGGQQVNDLPPARRGSAMMFQSYALFPHLNCRDNVAFGLKMRGVAKAERHAKAAAVRYGMERKLARVRAAAIPVLALEEPGSAAAQRVRDEVVRAVREDRAEAVLLGCAGMADLAARLTSETGVPVLDGVACAVKQIEALVGAGLRTSKAGGYAWPIAKRYDGAFAHHAPDGGPS